MRSAYDLDPAPGPPHREDRRMTTATEMTHEPFEDPEGRALHCSCGQWAMLYRNSFGKDAAAEHGIHAERATTAPESYCHRCYGPNVGWCAPSPLWNAVMRAGGSINGRERCDGIVCPTCFAILAEENGIAGFGWRLTAERVNVPLETVTPGGRTWDEQSWLWVDPA